MIIDRPSEGTLIFRAATVDECKVLEIIEKLFWACQLADTHEEEVIIQDAVKCYKTVGITAD